MRLNGIDIAVRDYLDDVPRMQVSSTLAKLMPVEWVDQTNAWMLEFFGTENQYIKFGNIIFTGPKGYRAIVEAANV